MGAAALLAASAMGSAHAQGDAKRGEYLAAAGGATVLVQPDLARLDTEISAALDIPAARVSDDKYKAIQRIRSRCG